MNVICASPRSRLTAIHLSSLMFVSLCRPPFSRQSQIFVKWWILHKSCYKELLELSSQGPCTEIMTMMMLTQQWDQRGDWKRETWHRETVRIVGADIARQDNARPSNKDWHREKKLDGLFVINAENTLFLSSSVVCFYCANEQPFNESVFSQEGYAKWVLRWDLESYVLKLATLLIQYPRFHVQYIRARVQTRKHEVTFIKHKANVHSNINTSMLVTEKNY